MKPSSSTIAGLAVAAVATIGVAMMVGGEGDSTPIPEPQQVEQAAEITMESAGRQEEAPLSVGIRELSDAYEKNEVAADQRFKGRSISVDGVVKSVGVAIGGIPYITLASDGVETAIYFPRTANDDLARLAPRDRISAVCRIKGKVLISAHLGDCRLVSSETQSGLDNAPASSEQPAKESLELLASRAARDNAEVEINRVWRSLPKDLRKALLVEQREFNKEKEDACERVAVAAGEGEAAEIAGNRCIVGRYEGRIQILRAAAAAEADPAEDAMQQEPPDRIFGSN